MELGDVEVRSVPICRTRGAVMVVLCEFRFESRILEGLRQASHPRAFRLFRADIARGESSLHFIRARRREMAGRNITYNITHPMHRTMQRSRQSAKHRTSAASHDNRQGEERTHTARARPIHTASEMARRPTLSHNHSHNRWRSELDDAADGASAAPGARAPCEKLCTARHVVKVVELEVPARACGASERRPAAAAEWQQQPRASASRRHLPRRRGRRPAHARVEGCAARTAAAS